jgi:hypothetical protein
MLAPELVEQPVGGDYSARIQSQQAQERTLLLAADRYRASVASDLERSEEADIEHGLFVTPVSMN